MAKLDELNTKRGELAKTIRDFTERFNSDPSKWTAEDEAAYSAVNADYDNCQKEWDSEKSAIENAVKRRDEMAERLAKVEAANSQELGKYSPSELKNGPTTKRFSPEDLTDPRGYKGDDLTNALHGWLMNGSELAVNVNEKHHAAAKNLGLSLNSPAFSFNLNRDWDTVKSNVRTFRNALSGEDGTQGGYTKDQTLINNLELAMLAFGGMMQTSEIIRTGTGEPMRWPTATDTSNTGRQVGENATHDSGTDPTFGSVMWNAYTFTSDIVKVPNELMTDSVFNLATVLGRMLGERLGRIQNTKYTTGTGAGTPKGITLCAAAGVSAASTSAIAFDELIDLEHSLDPSRRNLPGVGYMFHDNILKALRKLKDGEGRYLWQANANSGAPPTLNTKPYTVNQDMASTIASAAITVLFGELSAYKVRQVGTIVLRRLDERFADNNQTGFLAFVRGDGNLLNAGDNPVKKLTN